MHLQIDPPAEGNGRSDIGHSSNGANPPGASDHIADVAGPQPAPGSNEARTQLMNDGDNVGSLSPVARAVSTVIIAFQIGYTALDRVQYPLTFPRTGPLHAANISLGLIALVAAMSPRPLRDWRRFALFICVAIIASTTRIAVIDSDDDVLVGSIVLFLFAAGTLLPWGPRFQAALLASSAIAMLGYSIHAADPNSSLVIDWTRVVSAIALAQIAAVHGAHYRRKLAEQVAALAENQRLLMAEITVRAEIAAQREHDLVRLQASESMLRKVFDASPDNIAINSLTDGRFIAVNDAYQVGGYSRDEVLRSSVIALQMWPNAEELTRFVETIQQTGRVKNMEIAQQRKDGTIENDLISASVVEVNGERCVISMTRDITAIKRVETNLRASSAAMRKIFDATLDIIVVTRISDNAYIDFNQQFERIGYGQRDLDDAHKGKRQLWASSQQHQEFRDRMQAQGEVRNMEADFLKPDGGVMPAMLSAVQVELEGEPCVVTMIRDLTAAKEASRQLDQSVKALRESEETFRKLFDANLDSMTLTGADGLYLDVNQEYVKATGFSREEAIGHHFTELVQWIHPDEMIAFGEQLFKTNEVRNLEVAFRMKDRSEQPVLLSAVNLELHGQVCCLTISRGISDLKMTQRELVAAREAALAASRAKSEFLASMSHEIRTPMNSILGMSDQLMETALNDEQRRYLSTVISNGNTLLELINNILDLAKVESGRISLETVEFNLKDAAEKVLETLAIRAHEKGLELTVRFAPEVPELVLGDPLRLGQILINLVGNAIKFTHKGQVMLAVEADSAIGGGLKFTVTDTGIGIAADKRDLLFHPFSQADSSTSRKYGGSGLGLAIVARLVALMHGTVQVASEPNSGSAFSFTAQFEAAPGPQPSESQHRTFAGMKILLVADNDDSRSIVAELLTTQGAQVAQASSAAEAIAELTRDSAEKSRFELVVIDGTMPRQTGYEVAEFVMSGGPGRPSIVMMLGTHDLSNKVARLHAINIGNYIVKPVRRAELFAAVARSRVGVEADTRDNKFAPAAVVPETAPAGILEHPLQILMADDSKDNRALIRAYLKKTPYHLVEAEDGQEAIDKFIAGKFDLVLMDIQMPNVDGFEATSTIRVWETANGRRRTPIVALTASATGDAMQRTFEAGCDAHITKPVRKSTLLNAIRNALETTALDGDQPAVANLKEETCPTV